MVDMIVSPVQLLVNYHSNEIETRTSFLFQLNLPIKGEQLPKPSVLQIWACFRYMQLTANDIRRTTALLLKTSLSRNSGRQQLTQYQEIDSSDPDKESTVTSVGVTLAQLMGPKAISYRTKPKVETTPSKTVISPETISQAGGRWQVPR